KRRERLKDLSSRTKSTTTNLKTGELRLKTDRHLQLDRLQLVDPLADEIETALPEGAIGGVDAELGENRHRSRRAAVGEELQVARLERLALFLETAIEREHQELAETVGVAVKRRLVHVRDRQPLVAELFRHLDRIAELFFELFQIEVGDLVERAAGEDAGVGFELEQHEIGL